MIKNFVRLLSMAILVSGCAVNAKGPLFSQAPLPANNMGVLYIVRSTVPFLTPVIIVKINDKPFVNLQAKGYSYIYLPPGIYQLGIVSADTLIFMTEIEIKPGEELYEYFNQMNFSMRELNPSQAQDFLKDYRYVAPIINRL